MSPSGSSDMSSWKNGSTGSCLIGDIAVPILLCICFSENRQTDPRRRISGKGTNTGTGRHCLQRHYRKHRRWSNQFWVTHSYCCYAHGSPFPFVSRRRRIEVGCGQIHMRASASKAWSLRRPKWFGFKRLKSVRPSPSVPQRHVGGWREDIPFVLAVSKDVGESGRLDDRGVAVLDCQGCVACKFDIQMTKAWLSILCAIWNLPIQPRPYLRRRLDVGSRVTQQMQASAFANLVWARMDSVLSRTWCFGTLSSLLKRKR